MVAWPTMALFAAGPDDMEPLKGAPALDGASAVLDEIHVFGPNPGVLRLFAYLPPRLPPRAPLVVVLHGCGQTAEAFAVGAGWVALADSHGFALLCPQQTRSNNRAGCFNWFAPVDIQAEGGETASILQMIDHLLRVESLDAGRVYATGLSAGGALALALLAVAPGRFAAGAVLAGMPFDAARGSAEAWLAMKAGVLLTDSALADRIRRVSGGADAPWPRLSVWQGLSDATVSPANARRIAGQWRDLLGLPAQPDDIVVAGPLTESRWGERPSRLRLILVAGMGHGAPVDPARPGGGTAGRFLIDVGVASALEIADDWGLTAPRARPPDLAEPATPPTSARAGSRLLGRLRDAWRRLVVRNG